MASQLTLTALFSRARTRGDQVNLLLEHGADPNAADKLGRRPVHYAALDNDACRSLERLAAAMEARDLDARTADGDTAMHFAASAGNVDTLRALAECGAAPAPHNNRWETPLDLARLGSFNVTGATSSSLTAGANFVDPFWP